MQDRAVNLGAIAYLRDAGFSLLEVLVALAVTSIGLLGIVAMQANGLRVNHAAYLRSQASYIANDIADRMRANLGATTAGGYEVNAPTIPPTAPAAPVAPNFNCINSFPAGANACSPAQLAQADLSQWYLGLQAQLPAGEASIACGTNPCIRGSIHTVTIRWDGNRNGATTRNCPPLNNTDFACVQIALQP